jgi:hypothetical protein
VNCLVCRGTGGRGRVACGRRPNRFWKPLSGGGGGGLPGGFGRPRAANYGYAASASKAIRLQITNVEPSRRIISFFLSSLNRRVTVSRDEPIICAISSCVRLDLIRISLVPPPSLSRPLPHESRRRANFPAEERASTNSNCCALRCELCAMMLWLRTRQQIRAGRQRASQETSRKES